MESSIPVTIPCGLNSHPVDTSSNTHGTFLPRSCSQSLVGRQNSLVISGSFFGASSINHPRNSGVSIAVSGPGMERKLNRTRKMSENIQRVESKTMTTIPTQKEDITIKWIHMIINQNLLKSGKAPLDQEAIEGMTFEIIDCKSSVGEFSSTYSVHVTVPKLSPKENIDFVVKMIPENDPCRAYVFEAGLFEKENEMYFDLLPAIKFHCKKTLIQQMIPECIYGSHNMDGAGVLVFNCCGQQGFSNCHDPMGLKLEKVRAVIKSIAEFHASARTFVIKHGEKGVQRRYQSLCNDMYSNGMLVTEISDCMESFELLLNCAMTDSTSKLNISEEDLIEIKNQFFNLKGCDSYILLKNLQRHSKSGKLDTIAHGELWDRNLLMLDDKVKILDWKNAKLASATLDLAFLMLSSTTSDVRQTCTNDLLKSYHKVFCETLEKFGVSTEEQPSFAEIMEDYQISLQAAILQALCMFVQEMHYMTQNIAKALDQENTEIVEDLSERLKIYELRALTLFKDMDLSQIMDDLSCENTQHLSPASSSFDEF